MMAKGDMFLGYREAVLKGRQVNRNSEQNHCVLMYLYRDTIAVWQTGKMM
jgi:hypothetical protein